MSLMVWADIEEQYARHAQLKPEDVGRLEEWQRKQPHLPSPLHPIEVALFLHNCRYSIEAAKRRIDTFLTFRTHCPEFFANRDLSGSEVQLALDTWIMTMLPDLTPEGYVVNYVALRDLNPSVFNFDSCVKLGDMAMNLVYRQRGCCNGHVFIMDLKGATIGHLLKCNALSLKKAFIYLQTIAPVSVKSFHYVNAVPFVDKIMALIRPFLSKEFRDTLHVHYGDNSTIFKFVPREILPIECGGLRFCAADYYKNVNRKEIEKHSAFFKLEEQQMVDESKRPGQPRSLDDLFGVEGTFKNLNVD